jgi:hypothetical protein
MSEIEILEAENKRLREALDVLYTAVSSKDFPIVPDRYYGAVLFACAALGKEK